MKRDEDVWISRGTKASRPDELGPDQGSGVADRTLQARQEMRKGENPALTLPSLGLVSWQFRWKWRLATSPLPPALGASSSQICYPSPM